MTKKEAEEKIKEMFKGIWSKEDLMDIALMIEPDKERSLDEIKHIASICTGASVESFMKTSKEKESRNRDSVRARMLCYSYLRNYNYSLAYIGSLFSGRDHATVLHGLKTLQRDLESKYKPTVEAFNRFNSIVNA